MRSLQLFRLFAFASLALGLSIGQSPALAAAAPQQPASVPGVFAARAFGAVADGKTLDTGAIQAAIDACAQAGGGRVILAGGVFLSGTIVLKSNVTLYLESGATLRGSASLADYPSHVPELRSYTDNYTDKSLIYAEKQEGLAILGQGTIDGQGGDPVFQGKPYKERPYLIRMIECRGVTVRDVTIINSPMWVQHYLGCEGVLIDGVTVHSQVNANNDGIDIDCCERVRIANCDIISGDDAIVLKSTSGRPCRQVTVTNCVLSSLCNALKCGTESNGGFQDIIFSNCTIHDTRLSGIALEAVDGGAFDRVTVSGITMQEARGGIFIRLGDRARPYVEGQPRPGVSTMRNIIIRDVQASGVGPTGCSITGLPGHPVENVTLENIRIRFAGGGSAASIAREVPEKKESYPEFRIFGELPAYGFYVRHAQGVRFRNVELGYEKPDPRPAMVFDDVQGACVADVRAAVGENAPAQFWFRNVADGLVQGCRAAAAGAPFLQLDGEKTERIRLINNEVSQAADPVRRGAGVKENALTVTP